MELGTSGSPAVVNSPSPISGAVDEDKARALAKLLLVTTFEVKVVYSSDSFKEEVIGIELMTVGSVVGMIEGAGVDVIVTEVDDSAISAVVF